AGEVLPLGTRSTGRLQEFAGSGIFLGHDRALLRIVVDPHDQRGVVANLLVFLAVELALLRLDVPGPDAVQAGLPVLEPLLVGEFDFAVLVGLAFAGFFRAGYERDYLGVRQRLAFPEDLERRKVAAVGYVLNFQCGRGYMSAGYQRFAQVCRRP